MINELIDKAIELAEQRIMEEEEQLFPFNMQYWVGYKDGLESLKIKLEAAEND